MRDAAEKTPDTIAGGPLNADIRVTVVEITNGWARLGDGTYCMEKFCGRGSNSRGSFGFHLGFSRF